jgi:hypothetical protein
MLVADPGAESVAERAAPIAPRILARVLRDVKASDLVEGAPPGLTLADLDARVTTSLAPDVARDLRRAVADHVRHRWYVVQNVKPFAEKPPGLTISDLDLSVRAFNAMSRFPHMWLHLATIRDLLDAPGLGAGVLVEVLSAYEALVDASGWHPMAVESAQEAIDVSTEAPVPARVLEMQELYDRGGTLGEVAERFGISRERVRQLFLAHGIPTRSLKETNALKREKTRRSHGDQILELVDACVAPREIATRLGLPIAVVNDTLATDPDRQRLVAFRRNSKKRPRPKYTDDEIIECLRTASVELGGVLTTAEYTAFARTRTFEDGRPWPLHQTPANRFGSWRAALQTAGLEANPPSAVAGQRLFTRAHCIDAVLEVERELGRPPTAADYERAAVASRGVLPSLATVRHRCGGWQQALALAFQFSQ